MFYVTFRNILDGPPTLNIASFIDARMILYLILIAVYCMVKDSNVMASASFKICLTTYYYVHGLALILFETRV